MEDGAAEGAGAGADDREAEDSAAGESAAEASAGEASVAEVAATDVAAAEADPIEEAALYDSGAEAGVSTPPTTLETIGTVGTVETVEIVETVRAGTALPEPVVAAAATLLEPDPLVTDG